MILGGSNASASGALLFPGAESEESSDGLVDGIFFGEGEGAIGALAIALTRAGASRAERLAGAAAIDGFWRALSGMAAKRKILLPYPPPLTEYPVLNSEGAATARLQISSGCPGFCSFCLEGWESRPYREIGPSELSKAARELKARTGASGLDVYSFNFNAHARIFDLMLDLNRVFRRVNFMSQRLDILAESPLLASAELAADKRSFTLGIEGISERMRRFYRKGLEARDIDAALDRLSLPAVRELKLFYIVSGIEEDADFAEFADFAAATSERRRRMAPGQRVIASVGYLVRLPFTPLQYAPLCLDRARLESLSRRIEGICAASGLECRRAADFEEYYADQLLALGGRTLAPWLERTPEEGLVYDGGPSRGTGASLEAFAGEAGLLDGGFAGEKGEDWRPPLAFADENGPALRKSYLLASSFAPREARFPLYGASRDRMASRLRAPHGGQARLRHDPGEGRNPSLALAGELRVPRVLAHEGHLRSLAGGGRLRLRRRGCPLRQGRGPRGHGGSILGALLFPPEGARLREDGARRLGSRIRAARDPAGHRDRRRPGRISRGPRRRGGKGPQDLAVEIESQLRRGAGGRFATPQALGSRSQEEDPRRGRAVRPRRGLWPGHGPGSGRDGRPSRSG